MPLWSSTDANTGAPQFAAASGLGVSANGYTLYANTTSGEFVDNLTVGVFGVDTTEIALESNKANKPAHAGWILRTEGTGGRTGRIQTEVLVAMGSMTGDGGADPDSDGGADANDNVVFANT